MKYLPGVTDSFLDPITGRLASNNSLPFIGYGYIWEGGSDKNAKSTASLLDVKIDLRSIFNENLVLKDKSTLFPNSQGLTDIESGFLFNNAGILERKVPAPNEAHYIIQSRSGLVDDHLTNAQSLIDLIDFGSSILKKNASGTVEIAIPDIDYASVETTVEIQGEIAGLEGEIAGLEGEIAGIEGEILGLQGQILLIDGTLISHSSQLNSLSSDVTTLQEGRFEFYTQDLSRGMTLEAYSGQILFPDLKPLYLRMVGKDERITTITRPERGFEFVVDFDYEDVFDQPKSFAFNMYLEPEDENSENIYRFDRAVNLFYFSKSIDMQNHAIKNLRDPIDEHDPITKSYLHNIRLSEFLPPANDLDMGGQAITNVIMSPTPTENEVATVGYVDSVLGDPQQTEDLLAAFLEGDLLSFGGFFGYETDFEVSIRNKANKETTASSLALVNYKDDGHVISSEEHTLSFYTQNDGVRNKILHHEKNVGFFVTTPNELFVDVEPSGPTSVPNKRFIDTNYLSNEELGHLFMDIVFNDNIEIVGFYSRQLNFDSYVKNLNVSDNATTALNIVDSDENGMQLRYNKIDGTFAIKSKTDDVFNDVFLYTETGISFNNHDISGLPPTPAFDTSAISKAYALSSFVSCATSPEQDKIPVFTGVNKEIQPSLIKLPTDIGAEGAVLKRTSGIDGETEWGEINVSTGDIVFNDNTITTTTNQGIEFDPSGAVSSVRFLKDVEIKDGHVFRMYDDVLQRSITFMSPSQYDGNITFIWPESQGNTGQVLAKKNYFALEWVDPPSVNTGNITFSGSTISTNNGTNVDIDSNLKLTAETVHTYDLITTHVDAGSTIKGAALMTSILEIRDNKIKLQEDVTDIEIGDATTSANLISYMPIKLKNTPNNEATIIFEPLTTTILSYPGSPCILWVGSDKNYISPIQTLPLI